MDIQVNEKVLINLISETLAYQQMITDMFIKVVSVNEQDELSKYEQLNSELKEKKKAILNVLYENYGNVDFDALLKK